MTTVVPKHIEKRSLFERKFSANFFIDVLIFLYITSVYIFSFNTEGNIISKSLALLLMGVLAVYAIIEGKIVLNKFSVCFISFILFCAISAFWAINMSLAFEKVTTLLQIFILTFLLYNYLKRENKIDFFIHALCLAGTIFAIYTVLFFGIEVYFSGLEDGLRMGAEIANVNTIGMVTASAATIGLWLIFYQKKYWYIITVIICVIVSFGSASRKALISLVLGIVLLFVLKGNFKKKLLSIFEGVLLLIALYYILQLPIFETINQRMEGLFNAFAGNGSVDNSTNERFSMIEAGLEQFLQTPFTGVGIGNSGYINLKNLGWFVYLHNNYVELLASVGIIGTGLYYSMYITPLFQLIKPALRQNKFAILALLLLVIELILQYGAVQYYDKISYLYIALFFLVVDKERQEKPDDIESKESL